MSEVDFSPTHDTTTLNSTTYYLVDVENLGNRWIDLIPTGVNPKVFLFFTHPSPNINYCDLQTICRTCSDISFFNCCAGDNALDFQLCSYLGFLIASGQKEDRYVILSSDKDYDPVCAFWVKRGFQVDRIASVVQPSSDVSLAVVDIDTADLLDPEAKMVFNQCKQILQNCLPNKLKSSARGICTLICENKDADLQKLYQAFIKFYGQKPGLEIYRHVKPVIGKVQGLLIG